MNYKNEHITYVYLFLNRKNGALFAMTNENTPYDYSTSCPELTLVGCRVIHWGKEYDGS